MSSNSGGSSSPISRPIFFIIWPNALGSFSSPSSADSSARLSIRLSSERATRMRVMRRRTLVLPQCAHLTLRFPYSLNGHEDIERLTAVPADKVIRGHALILHKHAEQRKVQCARESVEYNLHMPSDSDFGRDAHVPLLIVISGPSGAGKDSVMQRMQQRGLKFHFVTTATTRPRRSNEVHGRDYWFVTQAEFARMIDQDELMEHALVYGDYKGVPKQEVREALESGQDVVMRLDVQGAETIRRLVPEALLIFITTDSEEDLINRLQERSTETPGGAGEPNRHHPPGAAAGGCVRLHHRQP